MSSEIVQKYIELQPVLVTLILFALAILLCETVIDFVFSIFIPGWHSPCGFKSKHYKNHKKE